MFNMVMKEATSKLAGWHCPVLLQDTEYTEAGTQT